MKQNKEQWWLDFFKGDYSEVVLNQQAHETLVFMQQVGELTESMNVYDQCCGKGYLAHEFDKAMMNVIGIDSSNDYIEYAKKSLESKRATFLLGDANEFIKEDYFDVCINWNTSFAYHTDDKENERMLVPFSKNLKVNGQFFICTMNPLFIKKHFQKFIVKQIPYEDSTIVTIRESWIEDDMMKSDWLIIYPDGRRETKYGQTKLYSLEQFKEMLSRHNLVVEKVYGDISMSPYDDDHHSLIMYGHKV
ncbi:MAG: class I SAM-dependent methyltransferase [Paludibacteraceae bacterium]|nr:class I SAM-dependent methyltransferase [Paludibacteraceae bacterium]